MAIDRANPATWGAGDKLTSGQANQLDTNTTYAVDKRPGETDTIGSVITCEDEGRIIPSVAVGPDANTTFLMAGGNSVIRITSGTPITADREYTLGTSDAVAGDTVTVLCESLAAGSVTVKVGPTALFVFDDGPNADGSWAEFLYTGTTWVLFKCGGETRMRSQLFTADGTFTVPRGITDLLIIGVGAGGGAGGGASSGTAGPNYHGGGGGAGGGGAQVGLVHHTSSPGTGIAVTVGVPGAGGAGHVGGAGAGANGSDGTDTVVGSIATFYGASGGRGGALAASGGITYVGGGVSNRYNRRGTTFDPNYPTPPGRGGHGYRVEYGSGIFSADAADGGGTAVHRGGTQGALGADSGSNGKGGGSGGGGANDWPGGAPGNGGDGGTGVTVVGSGVAGGAGTFGAGGGGGGGAARGSGGSPGSGGNGGAGGGGAVRFVWWK